MSDKMVKMEDLNAEQKAKVEEFKKLFARKDFQEKLNAAKTSDEVLAVFEEFGVKYTDEQKDQIRKYAETEMKAFEDKELSDEELQKISGGGFFDWFSKSGPIGAICGAAGGAVYASEVTLGAWATLAALGVGTGIGLVAIGGGAALLAWAFE